jgi:hypothetical protein
MKEVNEYPQGFTAPTDRTIASCLPRSPAIALRRQGCIGSPQPVKRAATARPGFVSHPNPAERGFASWTRTVCLQARNIYGQSLSGDTSIAAGTRKPRQLAGTQ